VTEHAPIALFAYRRPIHLRRTLQALQACQGFNDSPLFIFADGPKNAAAEAGVREVREILRELRHPKLEIVEAETNKGLANSIIGGVTQLCDQFGRAIIIEDDIVLKPPALEWFNQALTAFAERQDIFQVTAYQFRVPEFRRRSEGLLLPFTSSWGWATWQRAWRHFDPNVTGYEILLSDQAMHRAYNLDDSFPMAEHLLSRLGGHHDTWASRWYWAFFKAGATAVFPPTSLVDNIGFDETATHNNIGWLKRFFAMPQPYEWHGALPPGLPQGPTTLRDDLAVFRHGLRRTGAMRNTRIKRLLTRMGLWRSLG
jgi:hypothetical protein